MVCSAGANGVCGKGWSVRSVVGEVENWLAPGGGHGCRLKEGGGGWEMDTCDRTYVWSSLSAFFFYHAIDSLIFEYRQSLT